MSTYAEVPAVSTEIVDKLKEIFGQLFGTAPEQVDADEPFVAMGADSLSLLQAANSLQSTFGVSVPFRLLVDNYPTVNALADYLRSKLPKERLGNEGSAVSAASHSPKGCAEVRAIDSKAGPPIKARLEQRTAHETTQISENLSVEALFAQQLEIILQQLQILRGEAPSGEVREEQTEDQAAAILTETVLKAQPRNEEKELKRHPGSALDQDMKPEVFVPHTPLNRETGEQFTPKQRGSLNDLVSSLSARTAGSKKKTDQYRQYLADNRSTAGFRIPWKEICYPLIIDHGVGSRVWDIDGNEYVDLTCGFGSLLFGHTPDFLLESLHAQLDKGIGVGWQSPLAGKVAELICELTGTERVAFCNSGTEAVMGALRLARTVTGRRKIAVFEGSYHGFSDSVMVKRVTTRDRGTRIVAVAPGMSPGVLEDVEVLEYDSPASLQVLQEQASDLAAVIVEFPRSRRPDVHPGEFLRDLRRVTSECGIVLIFDEVVTGFRFHPGGAQTLFNVKADLITYGKALGGGVPIGVVAGKTSLMSAIDGGIWHYGDQSFPEATTTFFAGTYFKHPLVMPALWACLNHLKAAGPKLQEDLDAKTESLVDRLNRLFESESLPIQVIRFNSLFRFIFRKDIEFPDLFFYHLLKEGVYICETRSCFLSTAHTSNDLEFVFRAVQTSIIAMRSGGFLPGHAGPQAESSEEKFADEKVLPLTEGQQQLWVLAHLDPNASLAYNLSFTVRLEGPLSVNAMRSALQSLVQRHEALRIHFSADGATQIIPAVLSFEVLLDNLSGASRETIDLWSREQAEKPFDFVKGPLIRARMAQLGPEEHLLAASVHHIVADGISMGIFFDELMAFYEAQCSGTDPVLGPAGRFSEYVQHQVELQTSGRGNKAESYWLSLFREGVPVVDLPADYLRPAVRTFRGQRVSLQIGNKLAGALSQLNSRYKCTSFMTLLAGFAATLSRISGQTDLVIGVPAAGQASFGQDNIIGDCLNVLPLRIRCGTEDNFGDVLAQVKQLVLDSFEYQDCPLNRIIRKLEIRYDPGRPSLIPVFFNFERPASSFSTGGVSFTILPAATGASQFDLGLNIQQTEAGIVLDCDYSTDLFSPGTVRHWLEYFTNLLQDAAFCESRKIDDLAMIGEAKRKRLLTDWSSGPEVKGSETTVIEQFEAQAKLTPKGIAVVADDAQLTYADLHQQVTILARRLRSLGAKPDAPVAVCMQRSAKSLVVLLAIIKAGACYMPLDPGWPVQRSCDILRTTGSKFLLTDETTRGQFAGFSGQLLLVNLDLQSPVCTDDLGPWDPVCPRQGAYIMHTSGSTGKPKGVVIEHCGLLNHLLTKIENLQLTNKDMVAQTAPASFDISIWQFLAPVLVGGTVRVLPDLVCKDGVRLIETIRSENITVLQLVPSLLRPILDKLEDGKPTNLPLRWLISVGEEIPPDLCRRWLLVCPGAPIVNVYGPTECSDHATYQVIDEAPGPEAVRVSIGRPERNTRIYILDSKFDACPPGVAGEVYVGGSCVCRGYLDDPEMTAQKFVPDLFSGVEGARLYRTGDAARWRPDAAIDFLGRLDQQVKIRGFRIELGEIETVLSHHPMITQAVVIAAVRKHSRQLVAYFVPRAGGESPSPADLRQFMKHRLPEYMIPSSFVPLQRIPLNSNGKVDRKALPEPQASTEEPLAGYTGPRTPSERTLAEVWQRVLGIECIGIHEDFFDLGGDSILSMQVVAGAAKRGLAIAARDLLQHPTIGRLAALSTALPISNDVCSRADQLQDESAPLTPIQDWFFDQQLPDLNHFNTTVMLECNVEIDTDVLEQAMEAVVAHHDALRMRFRKGVGGWKQWTASVKETQAPPLLKFDYSTLPTKKKELAVEEECACLQHALNIQSGPLFQLAWFNLGKDSPGRFFITVHHLVMDVVSWPILIDSVETAYRQIRQRKTVDLGPKTTSFRDWADRLSRYAKSSTVLDELSYWLAPEAGKVPVLPVDFVGGENTDDSSDHVFTELDPVTTRAILRDVTKKWSMQPHEILIAALARSLASWTGSDKVLIHVEGHGRELLFDDVDLAHTIGWFTVITPVLLNFEGNKRISNQLMLVKKHLRSLPKGGIGYGILRYLGPKAIREQLEQLPDAGIALNYLGRLDSTEGNESLFRPLNSPAGPTCCPKARRPYLIDLNGGISQGSLKLTWTFSHNVHRRTTIEHLEESFRLSLKEILDNGFKAEELSFTACDLEMKT